MHIDVQSAKTREIRLGSDHGNFWFNAERIVKWGGWGPQQVREGTASEIDTIFFVDTRFGSSDNHWFENITHAHMEVKIVSNLRDWAEAVARLPERASSLYCVHFAAISARIF